MAPKTSLTIRQGAWPTLPTLLKMSSQEERRHGLSLTDRYLQRAGRPWIPISGELHYSRVPRARWADRLQLMRSGGLTVVASYVPWIHHVREPGRPDFAGSLDIAAFVDLCRATGLEVVLRIGPWAHAEIRNGGFPDWVQHAPVAHRTDDPAYLNLVNEWFGQLGAALAGRCNPEGVLAIQLENELYDQPGHLLTLKRMAREAGLSAPLWTATAWGNAQLPAEEVMPLWGGYGDGFWVDPGTPWHPSFREHYFFSHVWDDPGIGADLRGTETGRGEQAGAFPPATCELGGGMATAYHRRPRLEAIDIATVAHCKLGNGSAWQGYYMYAGGTNPSSPDGMQESHATGYPNDMPRLSYDFQAPIGEAGTLRPSHALLRRQHAFLAAFGDLLLEAPSALPDVMPTSLHDATTLRWALRGKFLFIAWHQPYEPPTTYHNAQFRIALADRELCLPEQPVEIPVGTLARWPIDLEVGGVRVDWATASVLTVLPGDLPTLVLCAEPGIPVELAAPAPRAVSAGREPVRLTRDGNTIDVLVLSPSDADAVWVNDQRLLLSPHDLAWDADGRITVHTSSAAPELLVYDQSQRRFRPLPLQADTPSLSRVAVTWVPERAAHPDVPTGYGRRDGRPSAPAPAAFDELAAVHRLILPEAVSDEKLDLLLHVAWAGDVAELRIDGRTATDRFWDGSTWTVSLRDGGYLPGSTVTLHILPLSTTSAVHLPLDAKARLDGAEGPLASLDAVTIEARQRWHERCDDPSPGARP